MDALTKKVRKLQEKIGRAPMAGPGAQGDSDRRRTNRYSEMRPIARRPMGDSQRGTGPSGPPGQSGGYGRGGGSGPASYHYQNAPQRSGGYDGGMGRRSYNAPGSRYGGVSADTMMNGVRVYRKSLLGLPEMLCLFQSYSDYMREFHMYGGPPSYGPGQGGASGYYGNYPPSSFNDPYGPSYGSGYGGYGQQPYAPSTVLTSGSHHGGRRGGGGGGGSYSHPQHHHHSDRDAGGRDKVSHIHWMHGFKYHRRFLLVPSLRRLWSTWSRFIARKASSSFWIAALWWTGLRWKN